MLTIKSTHALTERVVSKPQNEKFKNWSQCQIPELWLVAYWPENVKNVLSSSLENFLKNDPN